MDQRKDCGNFLFSLKDVKEKKHWRLLNLPLKPEYDQRMNPIHVEHLIHALLATVMLSMNHHSGPTLQHFTILPVFFVFF